MALPARDYGRAQPLARDLVALASSNRAPHKRVSRVIKRIATPDAAPGS